MDKLIGAIGMCVKSGNCQMGFEGALKSMQSRKAQLVLISNVISEGSRKKIEDKCKFYDTEKAYIEMEKVTERLNLGGNIKIITINDINFKKLISRQLKGEI